MSTALATPPWPVPVSPPGAGGWSSGRAPGREGQDGDGSGLQWVLKRNCSLSPAQAGVAYLLLCAVSLTIAAGFWWAGAPFVLAFAGVEMVAVGVALLVYARHAADRETVTLAGGELAVERCVGGRVERAVFRAEWLRIEPSQAQGSLIELGGQGRRIHVGRFLRPGLRLAFAQELRRAVRRAQAGLPPQESELELQR